jgi:hypothetical protein
MTLTAENEGERLQREGHNHCQQLHFWITLRDYAFLKALAQERDESVGAVLRGLVRLIRANRESRINDKS